MLGGGLWRPTPIRNQLENAILNLAVNARDAMPDGGRLTIETANYLSRRKLCPPARRCRRRPICADRDHRHRLRHGAGRCIARAFDPFFTTKAVGKGTGLGLSQVYGFVKQSGGHVKIYSEPGQGTTVKIYLPRFYGARRGRPMRRRHAARPWRPAARSFSWSRTSESVRMLTVEIAARTRLHGASTRQRGARRCARSTPIRGIALLFTDIVMPDMNGRKLADEAREAPARTCKVIYTTGYTRNAVVHNGVLDPGVNFLPKPFTLQQLGDKVREVLARATREGAPSHAEGIRRPCQISIAVDVLRKILSFDGLIGSVRQD